MEKITRVLVVDDNVDITTKIENQFCSHERIKVVKVINNGLDALDYIVNNRNEYDVILMDIILPGLDGVSILEKAYKEILDKKIIVLTSYQKDYAVRKTQKYGVDYYMLKPFSLLALETRILELTSPKTIAELSEKEKVLHIAIGKLLHQLGIPSHIKGYTYIRDSVFLYYNDISTFSGITKDIYPQVASRYDTTAQRVERAIRHAIEVSWNRGDYNLMEEIFGNSVAYDRDKPTNSEFIATLADRLRYDKNLLTV